MADISTITASAVLPANVNTVIARGNAAATITAGQPVYADATANYAIKPAVATTAAQAAAVGIALNGASAGQPVDYATAGDVTFNGVFTAATVYTVGNTTGGIAPSADLDSSTGTRYGTVLGIATSATNLRLGIIASGVLNP